jgi:MFS family permease
MTPARQGKRMDVGAPGETQKRLGPITLARGVEPRQILFYLIVVGVCQIVHQFMTLMQPLVLIQQLHVPQGRQGELSGLLGLTQQVGTLIFISVAGALADVIGRRTMLTLTLIGFALCLLVFPYIAAIWALFAVRFFWGVSFTGWTTGGATLAMDYPDNKSRGKFISLVLVSSAFVGAVYMRFVSSRLALWIRTLGFDDETSTRYSFWIMAVVALAGGACAAFCMTRHQQSADKPAQPAKIESKTGGLKHAFVNIGGVFAHAKTNPRFALILLIGCVVRTDTVVIASFLALWIVSAGHLVGIEPLMATKTAGELSAILSIVQVIMNPIFGIVADRVNRVRMLLTTLALTTVAFCAFGLITDVFGGWMIAAIVFIGLSDVAQNLAAQSLLAQEAPSHLRGSTMGVFAFLGTMGLIVVNYAAGRLFDRVGFSAPFVLEGVLHLAFFLAAVTITRSKKYRHFDTIIAPLGQPQAI